MERVTPLFDPNARGEFLFQEDGVGVLAMVEEFNITRPSSLKPKREYFLRKDYSLIQNVPKLSCGRTHGAVSVSQYAWAASLTRDARSETYVGEAVGIFFMSHINVLVVEECGSGLPMRVDHTKRRTVKMYAQKHISVDLFVTCNLTSIRDRHLPRLSPRAKSTGLNVTAVRLGDPSNDDNGAPDVPRRTWRAIFER